MTASFRDFGLGPELLRAVDEAGYVHCTPIQSVAIGPILEGRDLTGLAETGSGKTAAFLLPILQRLEVGGEDPRALIVTPTRELAQQVAAEAVRLARHLPIRSAVVYGGTGLGSQKNELLAGVDLVVGTPGRLIDFVRQTYLRLSKLRFVVLDEADRMLDMGFIKDVEYLLSKAPMSRQTLLFSATLPEEILQLAERFMFEPLRVEVERPAVTARGIEQSVCLVRGMPEKIRALQILLRREQAARALVFVATREMTSELAEALRRSGVDAASISSLLSQANRERVLEGFRDGRIRVLVATDVAGRGLDIESVSHVFNFDLPPAPDDYVHRVGRTGRKGLAGRAITLVGGRDRRALEAIEKHLGTPLRREVLPGVTEAEEAAPPERAGRAGRKRSGRRGPRRRRGRATAPDQGRK